MHLNEIVSTCSMVELTGIHPNVTKLDFKNLIDDFEMELDRSIKIVMYNCISDDFRNLLLSFNFRIVYTYKGNEGKIVYVMLYENF